MGTSTTSPNIGKLKLEPEFPQKNANSRFRPSTAHNSSGSYYVRPIPGTIIADTIIRGHDARRQRNSKPGADIEWQCFGGASVDAHLPDSHRN
jgi:hypothetical protein